MVKKIVNKQFTKASFRLPQTSTQLAQQYNFKPKSWWQRSRLKLLLICILLVILALIYSPLFKIKNVIINNTSSILTYNHVKALLIEYINTPKFYILPQDNLLIFSPQGAKKDLADKLDISKINFERHWPNVLRVTLEEDVVTAIFKSQDKYYSLNKRGVVIDEIEQTQLEPSLVLIENENIPNALVGDQIVEERVINFIAELIGEWHTNNVGIMISKIIINNDDLPTLYIVTSEGWQILITIQAPAKEQISNLKTLLVARIKDDQSKLDYVDVRFGNKLFYKLK